MQITYELDLRNFEAWSGAIDTLDRIIEEDKCEDLEFILEDMYPDGMTEGELNDLLWFEPETIFDWLGIEDEDEEEEEDWDEEDEDEDED